MLRLPSELLDAVASQIESPGDLLALASSCRLLRYKLRPLAYRRDAESTWPRALRHAARRGCVDVALQALSNGASPLDVGHFHPQGYYMTPICVAVRAGNTDVVIALLRYVTYPMPALLSCLLEIAIECEQVAIADVLLDAGADPTSTKGPKYGERPLDLALRVGWDLPLPFSPACEDIAIQLIYRGAVPDRNGLESGVTTLGRAIELNSICLVRFLLERGESANAAPGRSMGADSVMELAAANGHDAIVEVLAAHGGDLSATGTHGSPLTRAACASHFDTFIMLHSRGARLVEADNCLLKGAANSISADRDDVLAVFLSHDPSLCGRSFNNLTLAQLCISERARSCLALLLSQGVSIDNHNSEHTSPWYAHQFDVYRGWDGQAGLPGTSTSHSCGSWCLLAAEVGRPAGCAIARLLVNHVAADHDAASAARRLDDALAAAVFHGDYHLARLALDRGANVSIRDRNGRTPLAAAALQSDYTIVESLLQAGAIVDVRDRDGCTPLHLALCGARYRCNDAFLTARLLLDRGADPSAVTSDGISALLITIVRGPVAPLRLVKLLLDHGAAVKNTDAPWPSALCEAACRGQVDVVMLLLDSGARLLGDVPVRSARLGDGASVDICVDLIHRCQPTVRTRALFRNRV